MHKKAKLENQFMTDEDFLEDIEQYLILKNIDISLEDLVDEYKKLKSLANKNKGKKDYTYPAFLTFEGIIIQSSFKEKWENDLNNGSITLKTYNILKNENEFHLFSKGRQPELIAIQDYRGIFIKK